MELRTARAGWCLDVPPAEDDYHADIGPTTETDQPDDALDDADHVRRVHMAVPGWSRCVHPVLKHHRSSNSVLRRWKATN